MLRRLATRWRTIAPEEDGSTVVLYPFAVLIVLALGGLALDVAVVFQAHRESVDVAAGLASDIAGVVDEAVFATSSDGTVVIDVARAQRLVELRNRDLAGHPHGLQCRAAVSPATPATVDVECVGQTRAVLLPAAGLLGEIDLRGTATATARPR